MLHLTSDPAHKTLLCPYPPNTIIPTFASSPQTNPQKSLHHHTSKSAVPTAHPMFNRRQVLRSTLGAQPAWRSKSTLLTNDEGQGEKGKKKIAKGGTPNGFSFELWTLAVGGVLGRCEATRASRFDSHVCCVSHVCLLCLSDVGKRWVEVSM